MVQLLFVSLMENFLHQQKLMNNVNGKTIETGTESRMINSLIYVPLRAISSCFGAEVGFYNIGKLIHRDATYPVNIIYVHDKNDKVIISEEEAIKKARKIYIEDFLPTVDYIINYHIQYGYGKDTMDIVTNIKGEFDFKIVADLGEYYYVTFFKDDIQGLFVNKYDGACYPVNAFSVGIFSVTPVGEHLGWGLSFQ